MKSFSEEAQRLIEQFNLNTDPNDDNRDIFVSSRYKIITRKGIDKIEAIATKTLGLQYDSMEVVDIEKNNGATTGCAIAFSGRIGDRKIFTMGEASVDQFYYAQNTSTLLPSPIVSSIQEVLSNDISEERRNNLLELLNNSDFRKTEVSHEKILIKKGNLPQNPPYIFAMAEKRGKSRLILKAVGFYDEGFYSEDEADEFGKEVRRASSSNVAKPKVQSSSI